MLKTGVGGYTPKKEESNEPALGGGGRFDKHGRHVKV